VDKNALTHFLEPRRKKAKNSGLLDRLSFSERHDVMRQMRSHALARSGGSSRWRSQPPSFFFRIGAGTTVECAADIPEGLEADVCPSSVPYDIPYHVYRSTPNAASSIDSDGPVTPAPSSHFQFRFPIFASTPSLRFASLLRTLPWPTRGSRSANNFGVFCRIRY